jgi:hypothetical protein
MIRVVRRALIPFFNLSKPKKYEDDDDDDK